MGEMAIIPKAAVEPHWIIPSDSRKEATATGAVLALKDVSTSANKNSFQVNTKVNTPLANNPGVERGNTILKRTSKGEHPSSRALS